MGGGSFFFGNCFNGCSKLTNRPKPYGVEMWNLYRIDINVFVELKGMFRNCTAMPDYNSLPNDVK
ncbi:hypothetical protein ACILE2_10960 [Capnocytophaga canimorsus]|uniref:hypothetical protein n=1 Tax=Capnocytophaga canimorsus TaxID=28188 RepID=UPI0037CDCA37